jgi:hypothetical protein
MSGKVRYRDAREATDALHALTNRAALAEELGAEHAIRVKRKYRCNACSGWHLTSQERWASPMAAQAEAPGERAVPVPRRSDPLLAALAHSTGLRATRGPGLAA